MKTTFKKSLAKVLAVMMLLSCFSVGAFAEGTANYTVLRTSCVMHGDSKTQRGFCWFTQTDCDSTLQVVRADRYDADFTNAVTFNGTSTYFEEYYSHKAEATGLDAGALYYYRVGSAAENSWSDVGRFYTDDGDGSFSFLTIADVQASTLENYQQASNVMAGAVTTDPKAEFSVNLGDFVNDCTNDEWNNYGEAFKPYNTSMTLVPVAGNHEGNITNKPNIGWFANMFDLQPALNSLTLNGVYYSFDYGNAHFCVVNTNDMYPMTEAQRNWIIDDMNGSTAQWKIVLMHRSAYSAGKNIDKPDTVVMRQVIVDLMDKTGADLILSGHDHMYMRTYPCKADAPLTDTVYETETYNGEETTFAVNPQGAVYLLPGTAGTKRYAVNNDAIDPIKKCAAVSESLCDKGGCFADIRIDGDKLICKSYIVYDETQSIEQIDTFAVKKTASRENNGQTGLPTDIAGTAKTSAKIYVNDLMKMFVNYVTKLIPQLIKSKFGK